MTDEPKFSVPLWAQAIATLVVAVSTSYTTAARSTDHKVSDERFEDVTVTNCQSINELKGVLRTILASAPRDPDIVVESERFIDEALAQLQTTDCSQLGK